MQEKTYQEEYAELNLKDLFLAVLCRWRVLLAALLVCGAALGGYGAYKEYKNYASASVRQARQAAYETALETYQLKLEQLDADLQNLRSALERQEYFSENAIMLSVNQYNVATIKASYYIGVGDETAQKLNLQNYSYAAALARSYQAALDHLDLDSVIAAAGGQGLTTVNPAGTDKKMLAVTVDELTGILNLTVSADTEERAEQIYKAAQEALAAQEKLLIEAAGPHSMTQISEQKGPAVDTDFGKLQTAFNTTVKTLTDGITATQKSLSELKAPTNSVSTLKTVAKQAIKFGVVGAVAGLLAAGFFFLLKSILQDRLSSTEEIPLRYGLPLLGVYARDGAMRTKLDKGLAKSLGVNAAGTEKEAAEYLAAAVRMRLHDGGRAVLVGNCGSEKLKKLQESIAPLLENITLTAVGSVNESAAAVKALQGDAAVICVEEWRRTSHKAIRRELQTVRDSGRENLGVIVLV